MKATSRPEKMKEKKIKIENRKKRSPIIVSMLTGDLSNLPKPGIKLGYTKDSVIERVVRKQAMYFKKTVLFFIRANTRDKFMYCGKAAYHRHKEKEDDLIDLILELTEFNDLVDHSTSSDEDGSTYMSIVASRQI